MADHAPTTKVRVVTLEIDGRHMSAREDETILTIARDNGIQIPSLCYLEGLSIWGACRLCMVEQEGTDRLLTACSTNPAEGMRIRTDSDRLRR